MSDEPAPNSFSRMMQTHRVAEDLAGQEMKFERVRVRFLLRQFKLGAAVERQLVRKHHQDTGRSELRLATFCDRYSTFPFYLGFSTLRGIPVPWTAGAKDGHTPPDYHVHRDMYSTEPARFRMFRWVPFVIAYGRFYQAAQGAAAGRKIGLVFLRHGISDGMVIHNDESEQFWTHGLCQVYKDPQTERKLYVHKFADLVAAIKGSGWTP